MKQLLSGGDQYNAKNELLVGNVVTNAMFQFPRGAPILELALNTVRNIFTWIFFTEIFFHLRCPLCTTQPAGSQWGPTFCRGPSSPSVGSRPPSLSETWP